MPNPILGAFGGGTATLRLSRNVEGAFNLSASCREAQLVSALHSLAGLGHAIPALTPAVRMLNGFAAIVRAAASPAIGDLAAKCTTIFDAFRAPMAAQERARRVASGLNQGQIANLDRWGYPYWLPISDFT